ncbi:hypothetical protein [Rubinisphaera margarita]|uniref:hypothetical protein n=1 Tax=Rubinisphaera margarita TaxID=2909586 RepID=UPI001EE8C2A2|nr:hypothetical protein [Rubinisphaera margarita]MCG6157836.1 hypothetical protein [Rubinisphaera margarita]
MRRVTILSALGAIISLWAPLTACQADDPATIITARDEFTIPFRYDQQMLGRLSAREVVLSVSVDGGRSWNQAAAQPIDEQDFQFEPTAEGEYWFAVSVRDTEGRLHPDPKKTPPGLKVIVDRQNPDLQLKLTRQKSDRIELSWKIQEVHPDIETLQLEYRNASDESWKQVYIAKALSGQTSWKMLPGQLPEVRGRVFDTAGNVTQTVISLEKEIEPVKSRTQTVTATDPVRAPLLEKASTEPPAMPIIMPKETVTVNQPVQLNAPLNVPAPPQGLPTPTPVEPRSETSLAPAQEWSQKHPGQLPQVSYDENALPAEVLDLQETRTRHVNAHQFQIDYQVAGVGPSGVGAVELFITQDNGAQWWRYGVDPDLKSPMEVSVPEDGRYGFHFRIHSGVGNAEAPPQPGRAPQIDVIVDSQAPKLHLVRSYQGHGPHINQLTVQWQLEDEYPSAKPVALYYSGNPTGPWQQIDGGIRNTGSYTFRLPNHAPTRMYLRMVATDSAGNASEQITREPLLIDLSRPTARVITIDAIR